MTLRPAPTWTDVPEGFDRWCGDARLSGTRALDPEERYELWRRIARLLLGGTAAWLLAGGLLLLVLFGSLLLPRAADVLVAGLGLVVGACLTVLLALAGHRSHRNARRLARGVRLGVVEIYVVDDPEPETLEVLAGAELAWREAGERVRTWEDARGVDLARVPPVARIAAQWLEPVEDPNPVGLESGERELSTQERGELARHVRHLSLRPAVTLGLLLIWYVSHLHSALTEGWQGTGSLLSLLLMLIGIKWISDLTICLRMCRGIHLDRQAGRVLMLRGRRPSDAADTAGAEGVEGLLEEYLPTSRLLWTIDERPSHWRRLSR